MQDRRPCPPDSGSPDPLPLRSPAETLDEGFDQLARTRRIPIGFARMESICKPQAETLWILGGRPGTFKTGLAWALTLRASSLGARGLFVSLEMPLGGLGVLAVASMSGVSKERIAEAMAPDTARPLSEFERERVEAAKNRYRELRRNIQLHGEENGSSLTNVLRACYTHRFDFVVIDHAAMVDRDFGAPEPVRISLLLNRLRRMSKGMAQKGYRPWVILTSPLNRKIEESSTDRPPRLSDFRATGNSEYDTDVGLGLRKVRPENAADGDPWFDVECYVLKNRKGPAPVMIKYRVNGETGFIEEWAQPIPDPRPAPEPEADRQRTFDIDPEED